MIDKAKIRKAHKVYTNEDGVQMCEMEFSKYLEMEQALTPPTADEVCEALSEFYSVNELTKFKYDKEKMSFYEEESKDIIVRFNGILLRYFKPLPLRQITLIGRFYEGEIK